MKIRVGIEGGRKPVISKALEIGAPVLVSANSLWDNGRKKFSGWQAYKPLDVALDCGGFVAMKLYGGYRWSVEQYAQLASEMAPSWWAQMDFCCEPEIAADGPAVFRRIDSTVEHLYACQDAAARVGAQRPMPVLQGWSPSDYCSGPIYDSTFDWPEIVGIGSVCRRHVAGQNGLMAVVEALDAKVPDGVKFHLFGVKSTALSQLIDRFGSRIASVDSMAWNYRARRVAYDTGVSCDGAMRADYMARWYEKQQEIVQKFDPQLSFRLNARDLDNQNNEGKNERKITMPNTKTTPRGGLYAQKVANEKPTTTPTAATTKRGPGRPPKAKVETQTEKKTFRKARIRELYESQQPMRKSQIVDRLIAESYGTEEVRENLKRVVDNEASYMRNDGMNPRWLPEDRASKS